MRPQDFHPEHYARGRKHQLTLEFNAASHAIELPVLLIRGARPGRTLVVTAGVHGDEYEGIRAIFEAYGELNPAGMSGDLLAAPVCNPPAVWNGTRTSPLDGGNLARAFPGSPDGSPTEALAYHLDQCIIAHADLYLDLHSAGVKWLMPSLVGYDAADAASRRAAFAFGARVIWAHPAIAPGRTLSAARARRIAALYTEARGAGRIHAEDLLLFRRGIANLLRLLEILPDDPEPVPCERHLYGDGDIDQGVSCSQRGFLIPQVELLETVRKEQQLGVLLDLHGNCIERFTAPRDGVIALIHACPLVEPGEPLFLVTGVHP
jgi:predicted deacylase